MAEIIYRSFDEVPWREWQPTERATLLFVIRDGQVLLIDKKRGLGAGKVNGPGGRIDPGETPLECAIREVREELCVTAIGVRFSGELSFQFCDGFALHASVFCADDCVGEARETDEARPRWTPLDAVPFKRMWADDILWFPHLLAGRRFEGRFLFDGDRLVAHELDVLGEAGLRSSTP